MLAKPFSPAQLSCNALDLLWGPALTLLALTRGTGRTTRVCLGDWVSRAVVNRERNSGHIRATSVWEVCA